MTGALTDARYAYYFVRALLRIRFAFFGFILRADGLMISCALLRCARSARAASRGDTVILRRFTLNAAAGSAMISTAGLS